MDTNSIRILKHCYLSLKNTKNLISTTCMMHDETYNAQCGKRQIANSKFHHYSTSLPVSIINILVGSSFQTRAAPTGTDTRTPQIGNIINIIKRRKKGIHNKVPKHEHTTTYHICHKENKEQTMISVSNVMRRSVGHMHNFSRHTRNRTGSRICKYSFRGCEL